MSFFAHAVEMWPLLALFGGLALLTAALTVIVPLRRGKLRRVVLLGAMAAAMAGTELLLRQLGYATSAHWLGVAAMLLASFGVVNGIALAVFDLALPRIGVVTAPIVYELVVGSGWLFVGVVVLTTSGVDLTGVVAASTIAAAILTISLQNTLGDVVGGIAVQFDRTVKAGDWMSLPTGVEGRVREVRWRHTVVETRDGDAVVVPNAVLIASTITIRGRRDGRPHPHRIDIPFTTDSALPPDRVAAVVEEALRGAPIDNVVEDPAPDCVCTDLCAQDVGFNRFSARVWIVDLGPDLATRSRIKERIHAAMRRAGLPLGAPTFGIYGAGPDGDLHAAAAAKRAAAARQLLDRIPLFEPLTPDERDRLAPRLIHRPYSDGEVITRQGSVAHGLYLVCGGAVRVVQRVDGSDVQLAILQAPTLFGEMGLVTGEARTATVSAVGPTVCFRLDKADFDQFLHSRPAIAEDLSALLATRRMATERETDPAHRTTREAAERARILDRIRRFFGLA